MNESDQDAIRLGTGPLRDKVREEKLISVARYKLARLIRFGQAVAFAENMLLAGLPIIGTIMLFLAVSFLGFWQEGMIGGFPFLRILLWLCFGFLAGWSIWYARKRFVYPSTSNVLRRLEAEKGLEAFSLDALTDNLSISEDRGTKSNIQQYFWRKHQSRLARHVLSLSLFMPRIDLYRADRFALHAPIALLLIAGFIVSGPQGLAPSLLTAFSVPSTIDPASIKTDVWVNPPSYTGVPPLYLSAKKRETLVGAPEGLQQFTVHKIPEKSRFIAQVTGGNDQTSLEISSPNGESEKFKLKHLGNDLAGVEVELMHGVRSLRLYHYNQLLDEWHLNAVKDRAPVVEATEPVRRTIKQVLRFSYNARDDYGVVAVKGILTPLDDQGNPDNLRQPLILDLPMPQAHAKEFEQVSFQDLRAHPWAGTAVRIHIEAIDDIGQAGKSEPVDLILPERHFQDPLARAIIEERRRLVSSPYKAMIVAEVIDALTLKPETYVKDVSAFLGLRTAYWRLEREMSGAVDDAMMILLWDIAIHRDGGELAMAEQRVRELQNQLKEALANGAGDSEIEKLMDALEDALEDMMKAMASRMSELQDQTLMAQPLPGQRGAAGDLYRPEDLMEMLDNARELSRAGARSSAQEMLSQLENILENLNLDGGEQVFSSTKLEKMMTDLNNLSKDQQGVMDETLQLENRMDQQFSDMLGKKYGKPGRSPYSDRLDDTMVEPEPGMSAEGTGQPERGGPQTQGNLSNDLQSTAKNQGDVRQRLQELMQQLQRESGRPMPEPLEDAVDEMTQSEQALKEGRLDDARKSQSQIMDSLAEGVQEFLNRMMSDAEGSSGSAGGYEQFGEQGVDPLGRPLDKNGKQGGGANNFDTRSDLSRARRIFDELQRRARDRSRPSEELEYLDRLMKRF